MSERIKCTECDWQGLIGDQLKATNPFDPNDTVVGCPACKSVNPFELLCDVDGCRKPASCGTQTPTGYRHTCGEHSPRG